MLFYKAAFTFGLRPLMNNNVRIPDFQSPETNFNLFRLSVNEYVDE